MAERLVIVGAGGFGRETIDVVRAINRAGQVFNLEGVVDSGPSELNLERLGRLRTSYLGTESAWLAQAAPISFVVGVGSPAVRQKISSRFISAGHKPAMLLHPGAILGSLAKIGAGTVVCGGVHISNNVALGEHVHLNPNSTIGHDSVLSDYVSVNPAAIVSGDVHIEEGALIGAGATILQGLRIGAESVVGASACVVRDVARGAIVKGVPAR